MFTMRLPNAYSLTRFLKVLLHLPPDDFGSLAVLASLASHHHSHVGVAPKSSDDIVGPKIGMGWERINNLGS